MKLVLLYNAADYAGRLGMEMLGLCHSQRPLPAFTYIHFTPSGDDKAFHENPAQHMKTAIAYLLSALVDAEAYMEQAPIDDRRLREVIIRYLCFYVTIRGPKHVDADLKSLQNLIDRLAFIERISTIVWADIVQTQMRSTWGLIRSNYTAAAKEWDAIFRDRQERGAGHLTAVRVDGEAVVEQLPPDGLEELVEKLCTEEHRHELDTDEESWYRNGVGSAFAGDLLIL